MRQIKNYLHRLGLFRQNQCKKIRLQHYSHTQNTYTHQTTCTLIFFIIFSFYFPPPFLFFSALLNLSDFTLNTPYIFIKHNKKRFSNEMGKRITKKKALVRSSSIDKTVEEGKQFVQQSTRVIKKREKENQKRKAEIEKRDAALASRRIRPTKTAKRVKKTKKVATTRVRPPTPAVPRTTITNVARTGSRASNAGVARTSSKNNQMIEQELHDRLTKHKANIGKLNFSLRWWDPNDLDLHLTCPCGTHIYFGNKKCQTCGGQLDIDMNVGGNMSLEPVQHIFFKNAPAGLYKFWVNYYYGPKQFGGVRGTDKSKYTLSLHEDYNQIFRYEDTVSDKQRQIHYDYAV